MNGFEDREKAFENKFEHDEEMRFRIASRTARLFGLWAAGQMGLKDADAETYARQVIETAMDKAGHERLIMKVEQDLTAKGVAISRHRLEHEINILSQTARAEIAGETKT